jgi:hypothetical protein
MSVRGVVPPYKAIPVVACIAPGRPLSLLASLLAIIGLGKKLSFDSLCPVRLLAGDPASWRTTIGLPFR